MDIKEALSDIQNGLFRYPIIVKPVDSSGSKGVKRIDSFEQAESLLKYVMTYSRGHRIIVEEFVEKYIDAQKVYAALTEQTDILQEYIIPEYEVLHTQGKDYIVDDIIDIMKEINVEL